MAIKTKKSVPAKSVEKPTEKKSNKTSAIDKQIAEQREIIENAQAKIKELLAKKLNANLGDIKVGDTVYYPAPPQKDIIACKLEIEEDAHGDVTYFVRPICYKKDGTTTMSKRHYSLGKDLNNCAELYKDPPKNAKLNGKKKDNTAAKKSKEKEPPVNSAKVDKTKKSAKKEEKSAPAKKTAKLGIKKKLGKK